MNFRLEKDTTKAALWTMGIILAIAVFCFLLWITEGIFFFVTIGALAIAAIFSTVLAGIRGEL